MRWVVLATLTACKFEHGALPAGPGEDAAAVIADTQDSSTGSQPTCLERWAAGPTFTTPTPVSAVNTTGAEGDPYLTPDELRIYFGRGDDIYTATRTSISGNFMNVAKANDLSSTSIDTKVSLTADGLTAFFNSNRPSGAGASDVWRATRTSPTGTFTTIDETYLGNVDTSVDQWDPHISPDGLRLYIAPTASPAQRIEMASRASTTDAFGPSQVISELDSMQTDNDPTLTADERLIVWASGRGGNRNLWYALRSDRSQPFGTPLVVPQLNTAVDDGPHISGDGCRLYFSSDRSGNEDIFFAAIVQ